jgi:hypothetical protein
MRKSLWLIVLSLATGCAKDEMFDPYEMLPAWGPFAEKNTSGIQTPGERMTQLREMAATGKDRTADERARIAGELSQALANENDPLVRCETVRALGAHACPTAADCLRNIMQDPDPEVRAACCQAWGNVGGPEAVAMLSGVVSGDESFEVRMAAVKALGASGESGAVAALAPALEEDDPAMQVVAVKSLKSVSGRNFGNDVNAWREFAAGREPKVEEPTMTAQLWGWWK